MNPSAFSDSVGVFHCGHSFNYERASFTAHRETPSPPPARVEPVDQYERIFQALHSVGTPSGPRRTTMRDPDRRPFFDGEGQLLKLSDDGAKLTWIQLAKSGSFAGHVSGPFALTTRVFSEIIANFRSTQNRAIPIDYEHASEQDATSGSIPTSGCPATGWIRDLKIEGSDLFAQVEWLSPAKEQIRAGAYRYISPAVRFDSVDRVTGKKIGARLTSAGLTNTPFLDGMRPLAAKDQSPSALTARLMSEKGLSYADAAVQASQMIRGDRA